MMVYGYAGEGWKSGNYYTKYISTNPKFYTKDKFYGKVIYTPFWNIMHNSYQSYDCGVDCDYLGPRNLMTSFLLYIFLAALFVFIFVMALCNKKRLQERRDRGDLL